MFARIQARASATEERKGGAAHRRRLLAGLSGRVIEVGAGSGVNFAHYPSTVTQVVAVEPEPNLRALAVEAARHAVVPIRVIAGVAQRLPLVDASMQAGVVAGLLCSLPDPALGLSELARVVRADGELRFYEHVRAPGVGLALLQRLFDATMWPRMFGGCHPNRDAEAAIAHAGFAIETCDRFVFHPTLLSIPVAPRILGSARRL